MRHVQTQHLREIRSTANSDGSNRRTESPEINPARHPRPSLADQATRPRIQPARDWELRNNLTEHEAHQPLAESNTDITPEHRRATRGDRQCKNGIDPD